MKNTIVFICIVLLYNACSQKAEDAPTPTSNSSSATKICMLKEHTDATNSKFKFTSIDFEGKVTAMSYEQAGLSVLANPTYQRVEGEERLISMSINKAQKISNAVFRYTSGLLTSMEAGCICQGDRKKNVTIKYNNARQVVEVAVRYDNLPAYANNYEYDNRGNVIKKTVTDATNKVLSESIYTYDDIKHPQQLIKGLPFNLMQGYIPWMVNVWTSAKITSTDSNGNKVTKENRRTDVKTNSKGYATQITYSDGTNENFSFSDCD
jgi:hypothetical protein